MYYGHLKNKNIVPEITTVKRSGRGFRVTINLGANAQEMTLSECLKMLSELKCKYTMGFMCYKYLENTHNLPERLETDYEQGICTLV